MVNIIANSCIGGYIYRDINQQFNNPFMWSLMKCNDMEQLILNYTKVNWANFKLILTPNQYFIVRVDDCFNIHYTHYILAYGHKMTKLNDADVLDERIYEYVCQKYMTRLRRMISDGISPRFVIMAATQGQYDYTEENLRHLIENTSDSPYKKCIITNYSCITDIAGRNDDIVMVDHPINYDPYNTKYYANTYKTQIIG